MLSNDQLAPVLSLGEVMSAVEKLRLAGEKIILANGCFDLFHVGHLRYLVGAKEIGGVLLVALNSDRQTRLLKGSGRPYVPAAERAEVISGLRCVDLVMIFDDPTVEGVIRAVRPDFHAKGTDYTAESVPEREIVSECGGRVVIVGDPKDHSSTELIGSVRRSSME